MFLRLIIVVVFAVLAAAYMLMSGEGGSGVAKITGVSLVSPPRAVGDTAMAGVVQVNAQWVAVIPFAFSRAGEPSVTFDHERQWWGERTEGTISLIRQAQGHGLRVMLKPHIWVLGAEWVGEYTLDTEAKWQLWEQEYERYILHFAALADSLGVAMFCIGTELRHPAAQRRAFWVSLASKVRSVYSGSITYASNWDDYYQIDWWDAVDYIGIDAYFPLSQSENPAIDELEAGWQPHIDAMRDFSGRWRRQVLFTEFGFQSAQGAAGNHWEVKKEREHADEAAQSNAYQATFLRLHDEPWFAGGFLWKWYLTPMRHERLATDWSPQGKAAEAVIKEWYGMFNGENSKPKAQIE